MVLSWTSTTSTHTAQRQNQDPTKKVAKKISWSRATSILSVARQTESYSLTTHLLTITITPNTASPVLSKPTCSNASTSTYLLQRTPIHPSARRPDIAMAVKKKDNTTKERPSRQHVKGENFYRS